MGKEAQRACVEAMEYHPPMSLVNKRTVDVHTLLQNTNSTHLDRLTSRNHTKLSHWPLTCRLGPFQSLSHSLFNEKPYTQVRYPSLSGDLIHH